MAQTAVPTSTITTNNWYGTSDGFTLDTTLHTYIDETIASANDTDYIFIPANDANLDPIPAGTYVSEVKFGSLTDPTVNTAHNLKVRSRRYTGSFGNQTINVSLYQGTTLIYSSAVTATSSYANTTLTLSEAEAANITDYTNLRIRMSHAFDGVGSPTISAVEFEVPDAGGGGGGVVDTTTPGAFVLFL